MPTPKHNPFFSRLHFSPPKKFTENMYHTTVCGKNNFYLVIELTPKNWVLELTPNQPTSHACQEKVN